MKTVLATAAIAALSFAVPSLAPVPSQAQDRSITIPVPNIGINNGREQQAQYPERDRRCADLRNRADDLRYRVDHAQYRDDAMRAQDRLRDVEDQLRHDCYR